MTTFLPSSEAAAMARLTATVVRPTPPLGLNTATTWPGSPEPPVRGVPSGVPVPLVATGTICIRLCLSRSRALTWRIDAVSSSLLNGLTRNSRAPASIERRR